MGLYLTIPRSELKEAVAGFSRTLNGRFTVPVLGCVRFEKDEHGIVAQATNLDETLQYRLKDAQAQGDGAFIVPLASLKELTKGKDREPVDFDASNGTIIIVTNHVGGQTVRLPINGMELIEWPSCPLAVTTEPAVGFLETYRRLVAFTSTDVTRRVLNGFFIEVADKGDYPVTMVATDGRRLSMWGSMSLPLAQSVIVPVSKFLQWTGLAGDASIGTRTERDKKELRVLGLAVNIGPWAYDVRTIDGTYPNFRQVIPASNAAESESRISFTDEDAQALKKILPGFPGSRNTSAGITLRGGAEGRLVVAGRNADDADETNLELTGGSTLDGRLPGIRVNAVFLLDALDAGFRVFVTTSHSLSPLRSDDGRGGTHVLMPLRMGNEPVKQEAAAQSPAPAGDVPVITATTTETTPQAITPAASETTPPVVKPVAATTETTPPAIEPTAEIKKGWKYMAPNTNVTPEQTTALERALAAIDNAKVKLRETASALSDVNDAVKAVAKEGKANEAEVRKAKDIIGKLQALSLKAA